MKRKKNIFRDEVAIATIFIGFQSVTCVVKMLTVVYFDRVRVAPRQGAVRIEMKGIFVGAKVVRGPDWEWGQQDGGQGRLIQIIYTMRVNMNVSHLLHKIII